MTTLTPRRAVPVPRPRSLGHTGGLRITGGPWAERIADAVETHVGMPPDDVLHGFRLQAGLPTSGSPMDGWSAVTSQATFGQWVSWTARACAIDPPAPARPGCRSVDLVPLSEIPERRPYRVYVDLDAPRVV